METSEASGIAIFLIGVALLTTAFFGAYLFLKGDISILPVPDLTAALGEALAPLIEAFIRIMYFAVMVWIGSTITMRGMTVLLQVKPEAKLEIPKEKPKEISKETKAREEPKNLEEAWQKAMQEAKLEAKSA